MSSIKIIILLLLTGLTHSSFAQETRIRGIVSIRNSEKDSGTRVFVRHAQVEDDLGKAQPVLTDEYGQFTLIYVGVPENKEVYFRVSKSSSNLEIVNINDLHAVTGQTDPVRISMAPREKINEYRIEIYHIGKTMAEARLQELIKKKTDELRSLTAANVNELDKMGQLEKDLNDLKARKDSVDSFAQELARRYAPVNLDDASPTFRLAFSLFRDGLLDSALRTLNSAALDGTVDKILREREKDSLIKIDLRSRDSALREQTQQTIQVLNLKLDLHEANFEIDSVLACYRLLISLDAVNADKIYRFAHFLLQHNLYSEAKDNCLTALKLYSEQYLADLGSSEENIASTQYLLSVIYYELHAFAQAYAAEQEALQRYDRLSLDQPERYIGVIELIKRSRISLDSTEYMARIKKEAYLQDVIASARKIMGIFRDSAEIAIANYDDTLGWLYRRDNEFQKAKDAYIEELSMEEDLATRIPWLSKEHKAGTETNLGDMFRYTNELETAKKCFAEALALLKSLLANDPPPDSVNTARIELAIVSLYFNLNEPQEVEQATMVALDIFRRLALNDPMAYGRDLSHLLRSMAGIDERKGELGKAEKIYEEMIQLHKKTLPGNPDNHLPDIAYELHSLGMVYFDEKKYADARVALTQALTIFDSLMLRDSLGFGHLTIRTADSLVIVIDTMLQLANASLTGHEEEDFFSGAEALLNRLAVNNSTLRNSLALCYGEKSRYLIFHSHFKIGESAARKGLAMDSAQSWIYIPLANCLLLEDKYKSALAIYKTIINTRNEDGTTYAAACLKDISRLQQAGFNNKHFSKVIDMLRGN